MKKYLLALIVFVTFIGCNSNRLKTDEKKLANQILTEEEQLAQQEVKRAEREKQLADSIAKLPKGFRFKEDRKIDSNNPPVIINFTEEIPVKKFNLNEIAKEIKYIRLSVPGDSLYFTLGGKVAFSDKNIIVNNNFGVHSFSLEGEYIETIAQSNVTNRVRDKQNILGYFDAESYKGVWGSQVSVAGNRIFYNVSDYPNEKVSLLHYELKPEKQLQLPETTENKNDGSFFKGEQSATGKVDFNNRTPGLASTQILGISSNFYAGVNSHLDASENGFILATFNLKGDTLCKFSQFDKLEYQIKSNLISRYSSIINWEYKGVFSFMSSFNDTIFRLVPPNRLIPAYVFKFGTYKITDEEWYQTNGELKNKFRITNILENDKYLFLNFSYHNEIRKVERHKAIYSKVNQSLTQLPLADTAPTPSNSSPGFGTVSPKYKPTIDFQNNIDNGLPFWPDFVTPNGEMGMLVLPERLKTYLKKDEIKPATENARELDRFRKTLKQDINERVIMLVK